jgi:hypothetical protein
MLIEYAVTNDAPDGQPWPPALDDGWHLVRDLPDNKTLWRRISLAAATTASSSTFRWQVKGDSNGYR